MVGNKIEITENDSLLLQELAHLQDKFELVARFGKTEQVRIEAHYHRDTLEKAIKHVVGLTAARQENTHWINSGEKRILQPDLAYARWAVGQDPDPIVPAFKTESKWYRQWYETEWRPD